MTSYFIDKETFTKAIDHLIASVNKANEIYWQEMKFTYTVAPVVKIETIGTRFTKLVTCEIRNGLPHVTGVYIFVDLHNGNIHKAATYKSPVVTGKTKGVRGNIFAADVLDKLTTNGTAGLSSNGKLEGGGRTVAMYLRHADVKV